VISYLGGKSTISKWIIPYIPTDIETYVECFGGMFWVFFKMDLKKYPNLKTIVYNDINPLNANLMRCAKQYDRLLEEMEKYPYQVMGEDIDPKEYVEMFNKCQKEVFNSELVLTSEPNFDVAAKYLYTLCHIFSGGKPGESKFIYYHGKYRDKCLVFMDKLRDPRWREHYDRITVVENMDVCDILQKYDNENTYFYLDPPYYNTEKYYSNHDFGRDDHERVANCLKDIKGKYSLSYYEFPDLHKWYPITSFRWESKQFAKSASASKDKKQNKGTELLIMNYGLEDQKEKRRLEVIDKWKRSGLLDGLSGSKKENIAELYESQATQLIKDNAKSEFPPIFIPLVKSMMPGMSLMSENTLSAETPSNLTELIVEDYFQKIRKAIQQKLLEFDSLGHYKDGQFIYREPTKYPYEWENEFGKIRIEENGKVFFQPKQTIEYITVDITIKPNGEIEYGKS
jgi:DNA adenine methylase